MDAFRAGSGLVVDEQHMPQVGKLGAGRVGLPPRYEPVEDVEKVGSNGCVDRDHYRGTRLDQALLDLVALVRVVERDRDGTDSCNGELDGRILRPIVDEQG